MGAGLEMAREGGVGHGRKWPGKGRQGCLLLDMAWAWTEMVWGGWKWIGHGQKWLGEAENGLGMAENGLGLVGGGGWAEGVGQGEER